MARARRVLEPWAQRGIEAARGTRGGEVQLDLGLAAAAAGAAGQAHGREAGDGGWRVEAQGAQEAGGTADLGLARELEALHRQIAAAGEAELGLGEVAHVELRHAQEALLQRGAQIEALGPELAQAGAADGEVERGVEAGQPLAEPPRLEQRGRRPVEVEVQPVGGGREREARPHAGDESGRAHEARAVRAQLEIAQGDAGPVGGHLRSQHHGAQAARGQALRRHAEGGQGAPCIFRRQRKVALEAGTRAIRAQRTGQREVGRARQAGAQMVQEGAVGAEPQLGPQLLDRLVVPAEEPEPDSWPGPRSVHRARAARGASAGHRWPRRRWS